MVNCMRYLSMNDFLEIDRTTMYEYELRMKAFRLRYLDREAAMHKQAWVSRQVGATKKNGKPFYRTFKQFFDYEKAERNMLNMGDRPKLLNDRIMQAVRRQKGGNNGEL